MNDHETGWDNKNVGVSGSMVCGCVRKYGLWVVSAVA